jgi:phage-related baseplate assembly protein
MSEVLPVFVESDPDRIMAESKAQLEALLGRELQPGQVEQLMLQAMVYREVLLVSRFNAGMAQMLLQFSQAPALDYIAALVSVVRLPAATAACKVRFTLVPGHGNVLIPVGTRVSSDDGQAVFATVEDLTIPPDTDEVTVGAEAVTAGKNANGYAPGKVNKILDPYAFVSAVENLDTTGGGSDVETDEQLRQRVKLAPSQYSAAGSRESYLFYARGANPLIIDVSVTSPIPGVVQIVPLTESGETPQKVVDDIYRVCSEEKVRPLTDTVVVVAPTRMDFAIEVDLELYTDADAVALKSEITEALAAYATLHGVTLGNDVIRSHITKICRRDTVYDVTVQSPAANIIVAPEQVARCTGIVVNITGFNRG